MFWPGSQRLGALSTGAVRLFPLLGPSARRRSGLKKSSDRNRGLFAGWVGVASLGLSFPLAPPPASYLQWGWGGSSLEFLSPFVLRLAGPHPKQCRRLLSVPPPLAGGGCGRLGYFSAGSCF